MATAFLLNIKYFPVVFGSVTRAIYLEEKVPNISGVKWINNNLSDNAKVLYAGASAWYYMDKSYIPKADRSIDYAELKTGEDLKITLKELGITHIYIEGDGYQNAKLQNWRKNDLKGYTFDTVDDCQRWLDASSEEVSLFITTYYETRPFVLMRAMELNKDLFLLKLIKTKRITSRTRGTYRESEAAVYEIQ